MQELSGIDVGRYHIIKKLGQGGMAVVYKAFDTRLERDVALKFIRIEAFSPEVLERVLKRFEKEGKALARLSHGNIVQVHDYGEYEGVPYLVMEYLPGGTLKNLTGRPLDWREAFRLLLPVARGLAYAHAEGVVHRDVKPSNIIINKIGEPKLADFGIARILEGEDGTTITGTGMGVGTPEYMAPEQAQGKTPDGRADVYALGVVLYELITGRKPYTADTPMAVVIKQVTDPLPRPGEYVEGLPQEVEQVLYKALAKDPENRYETMEAFAAGMEKLFWLLSESRNSVKVVVEQPSQINSRPAQPTEPADPEATHDDVVIGRPEKTKAEQNKARPAKHQKKTGLPWWTWASGIGGLFVIVLMVVFQFGREANSGLAFLASETLTITQTVRPTQTETPTLTLTPTATSTQTYTPTLTLTAILGIDSTMVSEKDGMVLVYVPAGEFEMGSENGDSYEQPVHTVYLDAYWIDQTEVTNAMYALCVTDGACKKPGGSNYGNVDYADHPVVEVSWYDAQAYCTWTGRELPSEAQWEKSARGTDGSIYPWGNEFSCKNGNFDDETKLDSYVVTGGAGCDGYDQTAPVGSFSAGKSYYGALDMAGNVWEWVSDKFDANYYSSSPLNNPTGPVRGTYQVLRGGSWDSNVYDLRSAYRVRDDPDLSYYVIGFRCHIST